MKITKQSVLSRIVVIVFIAFLIVPTLCFELIKNHIDTENYENRELASKPELSISEITSYPKLFEDYYNDHLPFKNQFVRLNTMINIYAFKTLSSDKVILGKDYWLFYKNYNDWDPISCYTGTNLFTSEQLEYYKSVIENTNDILNAAGKTLIITVAPNKEQVYSEYMPNDIKVVSDFSRSDQLIAHLKQHTLVKIADPFSELLENKQNYPLYYKHDTHWTALGSFVAEQQIMEILTGNRLYLDDIKYTSTGRARNDLAQMVNIGDILKPQGAINIDNFHPEITVDKLPTSSEHYNGYTSNSKDERKVLVLGDSFREEMRNHLPYNFAETHIYHYDAIDAKGIADTDADVIILEMVERYLPRIDEICKKLTDSVTITIGEE